MWMEVLCEEYYENLCQIDGCLVFVGEYVLNLFVWQEGVILLVYDVIK